MPQDTCANEPVNATDPQVEPLPAAIRKGEDEFIVSNIAGAGRMGCLRADGAEPKPCAAIVRRRKQTIHLLLKRRTRTRGHCAAISIFRDGWVRRSRKSALIGRWNRTCGANGA